MNESLPPTSDHSLDRLIGEYLQAIEAGKVPSREELLAQHPGNADELRRFFADFDRVDRRIKPLEELCLGPTQLQCQLAAVSNIGMNPFVGGISAVASASDHYTHRRFRTTWDAVEWFQKNDPRFDWEARPAKIAR